MLSDTVLKNEMCIGCGNCAAVEGSKYHIVEDSHGKLIASDAQFNDQGKASEVPEKICPFGDGAQNETEIAGQIFSEAPISSSQLGPHYACFGGHVAAGTFRDSGTSGGVTKWIVSSLLLKGLVDRVVQVTPVSGSDRLFDYVIYDDVSELQKGSKASYYPVTLEQIYKEIEATDLKFAVTAIPCFAKAIRLMQAENPVLKDRIRFVLGIVCGGLKTTHYAKFIAMQYPIDPAQIQAIDFRKKLSGKTARNQASEITYKSSNGESVVESRPNSALVGLDYGMGLLKPKACDFCDDVVGETADVSLGDAWLPEFVSDPLGDSVIVVRNPEVLDLIREGMDSNQLKLSVLDESDVVASQAAGFRHRREGLAVRIAEREKTTGWTPRKRDFGIDVSRIPENRKAIYRLRQKISEESHEEFLKSLATGDLEVFNAWLVPIFKRYKNLNKPSIVSRLLKKLSRGRKGV